MAIPVILLLRGQQPFRSAAQACTLGNGCTRISVLSPQHVRFARACFGIRGFTMICGALKSASLAQGLLPPALIPVTEGLPIPAPHRKFPALSPWLLLHSISA